MLLRLMTCLLLLCASLSVAARDVRMSGANGDGGTCPELAAADASPTMRVGKPVTTTPRTRSAKPAESRGAGSDETTVRPPRWHSFLPGMFR